ncbi:MAG: hypothetical protein Q7S27_06445 [Nanoarchaeota archaeon]|nr:hypothetical protein [Nanoarchaeota archaeon]
MIKTFELKIYKAFLIFFGLFHLLLGIVGSLSSSLFFKLIYLVWHVDISPIPILSSAGKFFFAYMVGSGVMTLLIAQDIKKYRVFLLASMAGIFVEFVQPLIFFNEIKTSFNVASEFMILNIVILIALFLVFSLIYIRTKKDTIKT